MPLFFSLNIAILNKKSRERKRELQLSKLRSNRFSSFLLSTTTSSLQLEHESISISLPRKLPSPPSSHVLLSHLSISRELTTTAFPNRSSTSTSSSSLFLFDRLSSSSPPLLVHHLLRRVVQLGGKPRNSSFQRSLREHKDWFSSEVRFESRFLPFLHNLVSRTQPRKNQNLWAPHLLTHDLSSFVVRLHWQSSHRNETFPPSESEISHFCSFVALSAGRERNSRRRWLIMWRSV